MSYKNEKTMTYAILRDMADGVMIIGENNIIQYINPAGNEILSLGNRSLEGVAYGEFFKSDTLNDAFHEFLLDAVYDKEQSHSGVIDYKTNNTKKKLKLTTSFVFDELKTRKIGICVIFSDVTESERLAQLKNTFGKYVDPNLVNTLIAGGAKTTNEVGDRRFISVLFTDIRGFTAMSEVLRGSPENIVCILNEYLELTTAAVFENGGNIDKFIGDATMALFNAFTPLVDHVYKAVKAAYDIARRAEDLNKIMLEKYGVNIGIGIGVNCGEAIVGDLGPAFRKDYTAIGDTVNTAARLESNAKSGQVLISRNVFNMLNGRVSAESCGELELKGKSIKLEIFSVTDMKG